MRQNRGNHTLPRHLKCHFLDLTWLKQPQHAPARRRPSNGGAQLSESSRSGSWMWRKPNSGKVTRSPACWKPGQPKTNSAKSSNGSVTNSRRPPIKVGSPRSYGQKVVCLTKSQFLYNLSFLVLSNPLWRDEWQWVQLRGGGRGYSLVGPKVSTICWAPVAVTQAGGGFFCP